MNIIEVTEATFEAEVLQEERFVVVDFWATYCMPCQMLTPILEELATERPDIKFCKIKDGILFQEEDTNGTIKNKRYH